MIRKIIISLFCVFILISSHAHGKLKVVSSFSILGDVVKTVGGDFIDHKSIVGPNEDTHVYNPTPNDGRLISKADLIIINGLMFETWFKRMIDATGYKKDVAVASKNIEPHKMMAPYFGGKPVPDPHVWSNVRHVMTWVKNIREALIRNDPQHKKNYENNATLYLKELKELDIWIRQQFKTIPKKKCKVITAHDAFNYFEKAYGVTFLSPQGLSTTDEPSAAEMVKLIIQIKKENIKTIFVENISNTHLIKQLASETGAKIGGVLYSDALSPKGEPGESYIKMMRHNVETIAQSLSCFKLNTPKKEK